MPPNLDLPLLRTLVAVADRESFASAATEMCRTQSAVTQQMRKLEAIAGVSLFEKRGKRKLLNAEGQRLLGYARNILALNDEAIRCLRPGNPAAPLRLGGFQDVSDTLLPQLLTRVAEAYPMLQVEIHIGRSLALNEMLQQGDLDLALQTHHDPNLKSVQLRSSRVAWLCGSGFTWDKTQPLPLIAGDETSQCRRLATTALERRGIPWRLAYVAPDLIGIKAAVQAGLGVTARNLELLGDGMRILTEADGLPRLPRLKFRLAMRAGSLDPRLEDIFALLAPPHGRAGSAFKAPGCRSSAS